MEWVSAKENFNFNSEFENGPGGFQSLLVAAFRGFHYILKVKTHGSHLSFYFRLFTEVVATVIFENYNSKEFLRSQKL